MIELILQFLQQTIIINLRKIEHLFKLLLLAPIVIPISLFADSHYLFPSDIVDQAERTHNEAERSERFETQREWSYPDQSETNARGKIVPGKAPSHYPQSEHYKYDDFNADSSSSLSYPPAENTGRSFPAAGHKDLHYDARNTQQYPYQDSAKYQDRKNLQSLKPTDSRTYSQHKYAQENYADSYENRNSTESYPNLLFPGDVQADRQFIHPKYRTLPYQSRNQSQGSIRPQGQIRYIPVPVYGVPGTLPGTVPGVVTPGNMVPGYSHLNPNYSGFNNYYGAPPFMPVNPFNNFLYPGNPFGSMYNNYGNNSFNNMPFRNPNFLAPGLYMPNTYPTSR